MQLISNPAAFEVDFRPERLEGREEQVQVLLDCLAPSVAGRKPFHAWVHGPPGSGKTAIVQAALANVAERGVAAVIVNVLQRRTFYAVVDQVLDELRVLAGDEKDTNWKLEVLQRHAVKQPIVIAIDEIDQLPVGERNALLYNLASLGLVGLVLLSQSRAAAEELDARVLSRLNPRLIGLQPYTDDLVRSILETRARAGLRPETWCGETLGVIARRAEGDARLAIQAFRIAAYRAEHRHALVIEDRDVEHAFGALDLKALRRSYVLRKMPAQQRLLYELIAERGRIASKDLHQLWKARCIELGYEVLSFRTFKDYHLRLRQLGLLRQAPGRGKGFWLEAA